MMQNMDIVELCREAEALCRHVAPLDLPANVPLYVVPGSSLPASLGRVGCSAGFTAENLDLYVRDCLGDAWRGRGPAMIINDCLLDMADEGYRTEFLCITLHEISHVLERDSLFDACCVDYRPFDELVDRWTSPAGEVMLGDEHQAQYHSQRFIRTILHVHRRAFNAGLKVGPSLLCNQKRYGLSDIGMYRYALGDEPVRRAGESIRQILAAEPPRAFSQLAAIDLAWRQFSDN